MNKKLLEEVSRQKELMNLNEQNIMGGKNKYSTFFQLPYPLFELTIKGYYGKPVKYCLHMHKFNSKFNSGILT